MNRIVAISGSTQPTSYTSKALAIVTRELSRSAFKLCIENLGFPPR